MNIGQAAEASGISAKMIRYYERVNLIPPVGRTESGYRVYTDADIHTLKFIQRARSLGFSVKQMHELVSLWRDRSRSSANVKSVALAHVAELEDKIEALNSMRETLQHLAEHCRGDHRPDCPIIEGLSEGQQPPDSPKRSSRHRARAPANTHVTGTNPGL